MPSTQNDGPGSWTGRARIANVLDESKGGFGTKRDAREWARKREDAWRNRHRPRGKGPGRTTLAEGLFVFGQEELPFKKGALAETNRINLYLRLAGLPTLKPVPCAVIQEVAGGGRGGAPALKYFDIEQVAPQPQRRVVPSLKPCRDKLAKASRESRAIQKRLAHTYVADISLADLDDLVKARMDEGKGASTVRHDIHVIRSFINKVRKKWNWRELDAIEEGDLDFPALPPGRDRVMDYDEEAAIAKALETSYEPKALPAVAFLTESAMRFAEAMHTICWGDVVWDKQRLKLRDAKGGAREVPLSKPAMKVLGAMQRGEPHAPIFGLSYESLKAIFRRACERAGVENLNLHDLRHTAATRKSKRLNVFLLKLTTGHKTLSQLERYVNPTVDDAVQELNATEHQAEAAPSVTMATTPQREDPQRAPRRIAQPKYKGGKDGQVHIDTPVAAPPLAPAQAFVQPVSVSGPALFKWTGLSAAANLSSWPVGVAPHASSSVRK